MPKVHQQARRLQPPRRQKGRAQRQGKPNRSEKEIGPEAEGNGGKRNSPMQRCNIVQSLPLQNHQPEEKKKTPPEMYRKRCREKVCMPQKRYVDSKMVPKQHRQKCSRPKHETPNLGPKKAETTKKLPEAR
ncbi:hypothetical protein K458DRAFT_211459 [Lentithecium fluviatile CBS 122367]|uniref:Uncharacterized protein n=1 Tax=Lentithecium fluviatile CBS 122367 TaxID=1168545 RepID=A0A6G1J838_9PLEO|nr:hypothetical protein K458DRAFT_211459 [Lentithecium fluviatile CBS 122367]